MKLQFSQPFRCLFVALTLLFAGCSGGGGGSDDDTPATVPEFVSISGRVSYERIPFSAISDNGLDYINSQVMPARGVSVQLLDADGFVITVTSTDDNGDYTLTFIPSKTLVRVRVFAELSKTSLPSWEVRALDNTAGNAQYVLDGALASSGIADSVRNLHAASGWDNASSSYISARAAAPFAVLDTIYDGLLQITAADNTLRLPELDVFWSPLNNPAQGFLADGDIGSSFYRRFGVDSRIYILGAENQNTDEYDDHVILHELAHYFEDVLSRADTIGGRHNIIESLDMRLAFAEGFANAYSGMVNNDPIYRDSFGVSQNEDFDFSVESNPDSATDNTGWFVESSVHSLLYDFYDDNNEGTDAVNVGFQPIYDVLSSDDYINQTSFTTIFSFADLFRAHSSVDAAAVDSMLAAQSIFGTGPYGDGETNDGGSADNLPVYNELTVNGGPRQVCTGNTFGSGREINKLGNRQFVRFTTMPGAHMITVSRDSGLLPSNPAFVLHRRGQIEVRVPEPDTAAYDMDGNLVSDLRTLGGEPGELEEYMLEVFSRSNIDGDMSTGGDVCLLVTVTT